MPHVFAYGSNMDWEQMSRRCPTAKPISIAQLPGYRLNFPRKSQRRGCGVASVVPAAGSSVWGVIYKISDADLRELDRSEGFKIHDPAGRNAYERGRLTVYQHGDAALPFTVETYFAVGQLDPPLPSQDYKDQLIKGARAWQLPQTYITELENIQVS
jgi:gamma-glutamylcyclotransferase (GGCT)/AIG2-like uncharacterized protein YtfP